MGKHRLKHIQSHTHDAWKKKEAQGRRNFILQKFTETKKLHEYGWNEKQITMFWYLQLRTCTVIPAEFAWEGLWKWQKQIKFVRRFFYAVSSYSRLRGRKKVLSSLEIYNFKFVWMSENEIKELHLPVFSSCFRNTSTTKIKRSFMKQKNLPFLKDTHFFMVKMLENLQGTFKIKNCGNDKNLKLKTVDIHNEIRWNRWILKIRKYVHDENKELQKGVFENIFRDNSSKNFIKNSQENVLHKKILKLFFKKIVPNSWNSPNEFSRCSFSATQTTLKAFLTCRYISLNRQVSLFESEGRML